MTGRADPGRRRRRRHGRAHALLDDGRVAIDDRPPQPGQNILPRGREMRRGETVLPAGAVLRPQEFGLLATVGRTLVSGASAPRVAVLSTGDELVEAAETPGPGQIRNSNGPMLVAQVAGPAACRTTSASPATDLDSLRPLIAEGLRGRRAAAVRRRLGGQARPGAGRAARGRRGGPLPQGRDEAGQAGLLRHARAASRRWSSACRATRSARSSASSCSSGRRCGGWRGHADAGPDLCPAALAEDFAYRTDRPTYHPARLELDEAGWRVRPVPWYRLAGPARPDAGQRLSCCRRRSPAPGGTGVRGAEFWSRRAGCVRPSGGCLGARDTLAGQARRMCMPTAGNHGGSVARDHASPAAAAASPPVAAARLGLRALLPALATGGAAVAVLLPRRLGLARLGRPGAAAGPGAQPGSARGVFYLAPGSAAWRSSGRRCSGCASPTSACTPPGSLLADLLLALLPRSPCFCRRLDRRTPLPLVVTVPVVWAALEFLRSTFITGFAWYLLGHTQHDFLPLIQIADLRAPTA